MRETPTHPAPRPTAPSRPRPTRPGPGPRQTSHPAPAVDAHPGLPGLPPEAWQAAFGTEAFPDPDRSRMPTVEHVLLGTALWSPTRAAEVLADLGVEDFAEPKHRALLCAIRDVLAQGQPPEWGQVLGAYARGDHSGVPMGTFAVVLADALGAAAPPAAAPHYRRILLEARWRRDALQAAARLAHAAETAPLEDLHHTLAEALAALGHTLARIPPHHTLDHAPARHHDEAATDEDLP
jgi:hypothetical protein